jgi:preprotein translocase SecY subunit
MAEVSLYGIEKTALGELAALRIIFASSRGSLMELGIGPIVTAGLILQLLVGSTIIDADLSKQEDKRLFTTASKVFAILLTGVQASAYVIGGVYGTLQIETAIIVFLQLIAAGIVVLLMDELVQKGWGFGSGISLFIMAGVAQRIFLDSFGLAGPMGDSNYYGAFISLIQTVLKIINGGQITIHNPDGTTSLLGNWTWKHIFVRPVDPTLPAMLGFIATFTTFLIIIYVEGVRVELPLSYAGYRGYRSRYPIKLLYVSNLPVIFASALFADIYLFSQVLWNMNGQPAPGANFLLDLIGQYRWIGEGGDSSLQPVGGLVYYVISPRGLAGVLADPLRALGYLIILVAFCIVFSLTWLEVGGLGPSTVARQLVDSGMQIPGYRRSGRAIESILKRYIPAVTILGGITVALIAGVSDFFGVFGSGMGILLSVGIIYQYYETLMREQAAEIYPAFRKLFGG